MTVTKITLLGGNGLNYVEDPSLANAIILRVCREGLGYNTKNTSSPGNREAGYVSYGRVYFQNAFPGGPTATTDETETVYIRYKY